MRLAVVAARLFAVALWAMPAAFLSCTAHATAPSTKVAARAAGLLAQAGTVPSSAG